MQFIPRVAGLRHTVQPVMGPGSSGSPAAGTWAVPVHLLVQASLLTDTHHLPPEIHIQKGLSFDTTDSSGNELRNQLQLCVLPNHLLLLAGKSGHNHTRTDVSTLTAITGTTDR